MTPTIRIDGMAFLAAALIFIVAWMAFERWKDGRQINQLIDINCKLIDENRNLKHENQALDEYAWKKTQQLEALKSESRLLQQTAIEKN